MHGICPIIDEYVLHKLIESELSKRYQSKKEKKLEVKTDGKIDIHLRHNRHKPSVAGLAFIYFENKSDASYILQLSNQGQLKTSTGNRTLRCRWRENDRDVYSNIYQTDIKSKGITKVIKISNLHWKTTILHLNQIFLNLKNSKSISNGDESKENKRDLTPRWIRILEDRNGFPKCQALVALNHPDDVIYCVDKFNEKNLKH